MDTNPLATFEIVVSAVPIGLLAAVLMDRLMKWVSEQREVPVHMTRALGSLVTGREANAERVGLLIHLLSGSIFAILYLSLWQSFGLTEFKHTVFLGLGFGFAHGLLTAYALLTFVAERHPIPDYQNASLPVGLVHLLGHLVYGLSVGFLGGIVFEILA